MNAAHVHLIVNHLPVFGVLIGLSLLIVGRARRSGDLIKAGLTLFVVTGLGAGMAYLSGEPAEDVVEPLAGVAESFIEAHEEAALWSLIGAEAVGLVSLVALLLHRGREVARGFVTLALGLGVLTAASLAWTANLGGAIRHTEIRSAAASAGEDEPDESDKRPDQSEDRR